MTNLVNKIINENLEEYKNCIFTKEEKFCSDIMSFVIESAHKLKEEGVSVIDATEIISGTRLLPQDHNRCNSDNEYFIKASDGLEFLMTWTDVINFCYMEIRSNGGRDKNAILL